VRSVSRRRGISRFSVRLPAGVIPFQYGRVARSRMAGVVRPDTARAVAGDEQAVGILSERGRFA
jgi:hypothetical protein